MYFWIGCKLPEDFSQNLRRYLLSLPGSSATDISGHTLPQHISLKISFDAGENIDEILDFVTGLLHEAAPFSVQPASVEGHENILWIRFEENTQLRKLHDVLDKQLERRFGVMPHPFDRCFAFHSTLCMGEEKTVKELARLFADFPMPKELVINKCLLGISETGKSGSYRVIRQLQL